MNSPIFSPIFKFDTSFKNKLERILSHNRPGEDELYQESQIHEKKLFKELTKIEAARTLSLKLATKRPAGSDPDWPFFFCPLYCHGMVFMFRLH